MVAIPIPEAPIACAAERHDFTRYHEDYHSAVPSIWVLGRTCPVTRARQVELVPNCPLHNQ
jgi:hypothetical protein